MPTFILNKLVRDGIPDDQLQSGQHPVYHTLAKDDLAQALINKIIEEAREIPATDVKEAIKEIADVQQAIDDLRATLDISPQDITNAQKIKKDRMGGFQKGMFVVSVSPEAGSKWAKYYQTDPSRFIEVKDA